MNATGIPAWLRVADSVDSEASHSTTKGMASSMGLNDATPSSFFTALNNRCSDAFTISGFDFR